MNNIVLLSGGLDSTTLLYKVMSERQGDVTPVFFNYGQLSYHKEKVATERIAWQLGLKLTEIDLGNIFVNTNSSLINKSKQSVEVEFRNGVFISSAISLAMQLYPIEETVISFGAIALREPFYDCSRDFIDKFNALAQATTKGEVSVDAPFVGIGKDEVLRLAKKLGVIVSQTWSCYEGGDKPCGKCLACIDRYILEVMNNDSE